MSVLTSIRDVPGLESYLDEIEERLQEAVARHPGLVAEVGSSALEAGGKRLRPMLVFLAAYLAGGDSKITCSTTCVQDPIARSDDRLGRDAPPALVEPGGHQPVHHVVDRRDPVEHRPHLGRRQPPRLGRHSPHRLASECSKPRWSRQRATTKSTRSPTVSAPE